MSGAILKKLKCGAGQLQPKTQKFLANGTVLILLAIGLGICLHFALPDVISVCFYPLIILAAAYGSKNMDSFFGKKIMQRLGDWSFSIYLIHQPIAYTFMTLGFYFNPEIKGAAMNVPPPKPSMLTAWMICLIFIIITLFLSRLTFKYIELPSRNWINNKFKTKDSKSNLQTL